MEIIVSLNSLNKISDYKSFNHFLLPSIKYSSFQLVTYNEEELINLIKELKEDNKEVSLIVDKLIYEEELDDLKDFLIKYDKLGINHFFYSDLAVFELLKELDISSKGVYYNQTQITSISELKTYSSILNEPIYCTDKIDVNRLIEVSKEIDIVYLIYGYKNLFYSKRKLLSLFKDEYDLDIETINKKYLLKEATRDIKNPLFENKNGTYIFDSKITDLRERISDFKDFKYLIIDLNLMEEMK